MRPRIVFDTNVLFSGVGWGGTPGRCVECAQDGRVIGITCAEILEELADKLSTKLGLTDDQIDTVLAYGDPGAGIHFWIAQRNSARSEG